MERMTGAPVRAHSRDIPHGPGAREDEEDDISPSVEGSVSP